ncbi:MAG: MFS transporter [Chloroflexota bacterium]|nr:MFS transporter [Chloroflexota bacterium]MDE2921077.1 MFS transporter [Chloroflexota bacterium]
MIGRVLQLRVADPRPGVLRHRNFALFWFSLVISHSGTWMQILVVGWLTDEMTRSAFWVGMVAAARGVPMVVLPFFGGVVADRMDRRTLLWITQVSQALLGLILAIVVAADVAQVWHFAVIAMLASIAGAFDQPTRQAIVPALVPREDLRKAIALHAVVFTGGALLGPAIAGLLVPVIGAAGVLFINAASTLPVFVALALLNLPPFKPRPREAVLKSVRDGLRFAFSRELIVLVLLVSAVASLFGRSFQQLAPVFAREVLFADVTGLGWLIAAPGLGSVIGAFVVASANWLPANGRLAGIAVAGYLAALVGFAVSTSLGLSLVLLVLVGLLITVFSACVRTMLQLEATEAYYGRVMSLNTITFIGLSPVGALVIGAIAESVGIQAATLIGAAVVAMVFAVVWVARPTLRRAT